MLYRRRDSVRGSGGYCWIELRGMVEIEQEIKSRFSEEMMPSSFYVPGILLEQYKKC